MTEKSATPSHSLHRIMIRLPDDLHSELSELARRNHRSVSAQGAFMLAGALEDMKTASGPTA